MRALSTILSAVDAWAETTRAAARSRDYRHGYTDGYAAAQEHERQRAERLTRNVNIGSVAPTNPREEEDNMNNDNKKYELADETCEMAGRTLHRIRAVRDIPWWGVKAGDLGGWIEKEWNLAHGGDAWVFDNAKVYGNAGVYGNALVSDNARVFDSARVYDDAQVFDNAWVFDDAQVYADAQVYGNARVSDNADILTAGPVGAEGITVTITRTPNGHRIHAGCAGNLTPDELRAEVERRRKHVWDTTPALETLWVTQYEHIASLAEAMEAAWKDNTNA